MLYIADLVISAIKFAESEVSAFRRGVFRTTVAIAILFAAIVCLLAGFGFILAGLFLLLRGPIGPIGAAFAVGVIVVFMAAVLAVIARAYAR